MVYYELQPLLLKVMHEKIPIFIFCYKYGNSWNGRSKKRNNIKTL